MTTDDQSKPPAVQGAEQKSEHPRKPQLFKILIDKTFYEISNPDPTGRDLLMLAGKNPPEQYAIYLKTKGGGQPVRISLTGTVNLREPGVERFVTLPLDQTEG